MKWRDCRLWIVGALLLLSVHGYGAFKLAPIDPDLMSGAPHLVNRTVAFTPQKLFETVPQGVANLRYGQAVFKGHTIKFIAFGTPNSAGPDTLIFDTNGDGDLTDEKRWTGMAGTPTGKPIALPLPDGSTYEANVILSAWYVIFRPTSLYQGTVDIDGQACKAVLIDLTMDGFTPDSRRDLLLIDINRNGRFDIDISSATNVEYQFLGGEIYLKGKLYTTTLDAQKPDVIVQRYTGEQGSIDLDLSRLKMRPKDFTLDGYLTGVSGSTSFHAKKDYFPMAVKGRRTKLGSGILTLTDEEGLQYILQFQMGQSLELTPDKPTIIALGKLNPWQINVYQSGRTIRVSQSLTGEQGIVYQRAYAIPKGQQTSAYGAQGPAVRILTQGGKELAKGAMEYG